MKYTFMVLRQIHDYIGDQEEIFFFKKQNTYKGFLGWLICQKAEDPGVGTAEITEPLIGNPGCRGYQPLCLCIIPYREGR